MIHEDANWENRAPCGWSCFPNILVATVMLDWQQVDGHIPCWSMGGQFYMHGIALAFFVIGGLDSDEMTSGLMGARVIRSATERRAAGVLVEWSRLYDFL